MGTLSILTAMTAAFFASSAFAQEEGKALKHYARTGVLISMYEDTSFRDVNCNSEKPAALYGCGKDPSGNDRQSFVDFESGTGFQLGYGYHVAPPFRVEASLERQVNLKIGGKPNFSYQGALLEQDFSSSMNVTSLTAWGIADTPGFSSPFGRELNFFGGGGLGVSRLSMEKTILGFPKTYTVVPGGTEINLVFGITAGLSQRVSERFVFDVAWRYMDYGAVRTDRGDGEVVFRSGSRNPIPLDLAPTKAELRGNEILASMRYLF